MDLQWLAPAFEAEGPFASVTLDVSRTDASGEHEVELRWRELRRRLEEQGAPEDVLDVLAERAVAPSGRTDTGDGSGRVVVAGAGGVVLDLVLPTAPPQDEALWGAVPHVLPAVRAAAGATRYLLVATDRAGADLTVAVGSGVTTALPEGGDAVVGSSVAAVEASESSGADDNILHKVPVGGTGEYTRERRVEDSWQRDAAAVAKDVDDLVSRYKPHVVVLTGDENAVALVRERLGGAASAIAEVVQGGGRAEGIRSEDFAQTLGEVLAKVQEQRLREVMDSYAQARGKDADAADGLDAVVQMLQRGQVQDVLLRDDPSSTWTLWVGPDPMQLAGSREDLLEMGVQEPVEVRADAALVRAAVAGSAGLVLVPGTRQDETDELELGDGVGAILRWSDQGTPGSGAPTMSGDSERLRDLGA